ncbi:hypothetical protein SMB34_08335 [Thalassospira permensis NBRC 106175]|uniref:Uncharacterized protein n=1 Tax=Thalassospira permensis NBRC 106175 TaxID=1353532 RepID=A0ABR4TJ92_9PROT|nr:hypothetical protein SMB34_08335 [Thalassospira permensis NBRC 106175]
MVHVMAFARCDVILPAADIFQHVKLIHDVIHAGIIGKPRNRVDCILFYRAAHTDFPVMFRQKITVSVEKLQVVWACLWAAVPGL